MFIDVIFTYEGQPQRHVQYPFHRVLLQDRNTLFEFLVSLMRNDKIERESLVKVSTCIYETLGEELPEWFLAKDVSTPSKWYETEIQEYFTAHPLPDYTEAEETDS